MKQEGRDWRALLVDGTETLERGDRAGARDLLLEALRDAADQRPERRSPQSRALEKRLWDLVHRYGDAGRIETGAPRLARELSEIAAACLALHEEIAERKRGREQGE